MVTVVAGVRMSPGEARVAEFLRDRRWHSTREIQRACEVTVNSRVSDLRKRGFVIKKKGPIPGEVGAMAYAYRLIRVPDVASGGVPAAVASEPRRRRRGQGKGRVMAPAGGFVQPSLFDSGLAA